MNLIGNLNASFKNIQDNLAETDRVGGRAGEAAMGISSILPIGNYVKIDEVKKLIGEPVYIKENGCCVLLSGDSVHVEAGGRWGQRVSHNSGENFFYGRRAGCIGKRY